MIARAAMAALIAGAAACGGGQRQAAPAAHGDVSDTAGRALGSAHVVADGDGARIRLQVRGLSPGEHGVHIHDGAECGTAGDSGGAFNRAGPHFDPTAAGVHDGPNGPGHAGDLGNIAIGSDSSGSLELTSKRLSVARGGNGVVGKPLVIHANRDNLTDTPPNGGSGDRVACGILGL